jgi:hypothetical protein
VLTAGVPRQRAARPPPGVQRKVVRSQIARRAMNEAIVGIARAVRFEQRTAALPPEERRAVRDLGLHFETSPEAARAALRGALLRGEVHLSERRRQSRGVARQETRSQSRAVGVRSSLRIDQIASLGTARRIARPHAGIFLEARVRAREGRPVREQEGRLPAIGDRSRAFRVPRVRGRSPMALLVVAPFVVVRRLKSRVVKMTDSAVVVRRVAHRVTALLARVRRVIHEQEIAAVRRR